MTIELSQEQAKARSEFRDFARSHVAPVAAQIDRDEWIPDPLIERLRSARYLGFGLPHDLGGQSADATTQGLLHEELAWGSASVEGLVNVHQMASAAIARWGSSSQKRAWIPELAAGRKLAAFAVTEPNVGSDAKSVETTAKRVAGGYAIEGRKRWITCAQRADVFVVLARCDGEPTAFLLFRESPGLSITPITGVLGCRGYMLGELQLEGCRVTEAELLGRVGVGFSHVAGASLTLGRYNLAWACHGMARACIERSLGYASERRQFGALLKDLELVQRMLARMMTDANASWLLCLQAARSRALRRPRASIDAAMAKYFASTSLGRIAADAVQIHGACGCSSETPLERIFRDAKIMEIVEGTTQVLETLISRSASMLVDAPTMDTETAD